MCQHSITIILRTNDFLFELFSLVQTAWSIGTLILIKIVLIVKSHHTAAISIRHIDTPHEPVLLISHHQLRNTSRGNKYLYSFLMCFADGNKVFFVLLAFLITWNNTYYIHLRMCLCIYKGSTLIPLHMQSAFPEF